MFIPALPIDAHALFLRYTLECAIRHAKILYLLDLICRIPKGQVALKMFFHLNRMDFN